MDITKMSITELKALKSDIYENIQINQNNLQILNNEIQKRQNEKIDKKLKDKV